VRVGFGIAVPPGVESRITVTKRALDDDDLTSLVDVQIGIPETGLQLQRAAAIVAPVAPAGASPFPRPPQ